jgi:hypothetical protein
MMPEHATCASIGGRSGVEGRPRRRNWTKARASSIEIERMEMASVRPEEPPSEAGGSDVKVAVS